MWQFGKLIRFYALAIRIRYCLSAIAVFRCFINIQKDADEWKLTQAGCTNIAIYAPNLRYVLLRRYQQFCTLMVNGNAYNQNLLIAVTHWVEKTDLIRSAVWSYSTVHAKKVRLALATPLWKQLSHFISETPRGPVAVSDACHNRIEFYLFESNFIRRF